VNLTQGTWLVGEFDGTAERTVSPTKDGKQFSPFGVEEVRIIVMDEPRTVGWREGKRPPTADFALGELIAVPVRVRGMFNGAPQFDGRSLPILSAEAE
jgi:hypothetical protein